MGKGVITEKENTHKFKINKELSNSSTNLFETDFIICLKLWLTVCFISLLYYWFIIDNPLFSQWTQIEINLKIVGKM